MTFFAVPDSALHHGHDHEEDQRGYRHIFNMAFESNYDLDHHHSDALPYFDGTIPDLAGILTSLDKLMDEEPNPEELNNPDKERRKRVIRFFICAVLQYHTLPAKYSVEALQYNATYPTHLSIPAAFGGQHQRIRVSHEYKKRDTKTLINGFSQIEIGDIQASNGLIHVVNHPIIPPAPIFAELFQFPKFFSTFVCSFRSQLFTIDA